MAPLFLLICPELALLAVVIAHLVEVLGPAGRHHVLRFLLSSPPHDHLRLVLIVNGAAVQKRRSLTQKSVVVTEQKNRRNINGKLSSSSLRALSGNRSLSLFPTHLTIVMCCIKVRTVLYPLLAAVFAALDRRTQESISGLGPLC